MPRTQPVFWFIWGGDIGISNLSCYTSSTRRLSETGTSFSQPAHGFHDMWCGKPMPLQLGFTVQPFEEMAKCDPSLRDRQPWKAAANQVLHGRSNHVPGAEQAVEWGAKEGWAAVSIRDDWGQVIAAAGS